MFSCSTVKQNIKYSNEVKTLRTEKRGLKKITKHETDQVLRKNSIIQYKALQEKIALQIKFEKKEYAKKRIMKIIQDSSQNALWGEKKQVSRNPAAEVTVLKDQDGIRQYSPLAIKECHASYYETLYTRKPVKFHPHHQKITEEMTALFIQKMTSTSTSPGRC